MLLIAMDQILDATYQIEQSMKNVLPSVLLEPQVWDTYNMDFITNDSMGFFIPLT